MSVLDFEKEVNAFSEHYGIDPDRIKSFIQKKLDEIDTDDEYQRRMYVLNKLKGHCESYSNFNGVSFDFYVFAIKEPRDAYASKREAILQSWMESDESVRNKMIRDGNVLSVVKDGKRVAKLDEFGNPLPARKDKNGKVRQMTVNMVGNLFGFAQNEDGLFDPICLTVWGEFANPDFDSCILKPENNFSKLEVSGYIKNKGTVTEVSLADKFGVINDGKLNWDDIKEILSNLSENGQDVFAGLGFNGDGRLDINRYHDEIQMQGGEYKWNHFCVVEGIVTGYFAGNERSSPNMSLTAPFDGSFDEIPDTTAWLDNQIDVVNTAQVLVVGRTTRGTKKDEDGNPMEDVLADASMNAYSVFLIDKHLPTKKVEVEEEDISKHFDAELEFE
jgi:hypothetical protein